MCALGLAKLLSDGCVTVEPYEETIRERIQHLILSTQQKSAVCTTVCHSL